MPFIPDDSPIGGAASGFIYPLRSGIGRDAPPEPPTPSFSETLGAAFGRENSLASIISSYRNEAYPVDPSHNPFDMIKGTDYETNHLNEFLDSRSEAETRDIMSRIDMERERDATLEASGWAGTVLSVAAGLTDPVNFIPFTATVRAARAGQRFLQGASQVARAGAVSTALAEGALQASQVTRTPEESAINIGASTILSGLIGGAAASMLGRESAEALEGAITRTRERIRRDNGGGPAPVGAAVADERDLELMDFTGPVGRLLDDAADRVEKVRGIGRPIAAALRFPRDVFERLSPTMTVFSSPNIHTRRAGADLTESALSFREGEAGTPTSYNIPVGALAKLRGNKMLIDFTDELDAQWRQHFFGSDKGQIGDKVRAEIARITGRQQDGKLTFSQFKEEASRAAYSGDTHPIPEIAAAAKAYRQIIDDPLVDQAVQAGLFKEKPNPPAGDQSHLARVWNKAAIIADEGRFVESVKNWYKRDQDVKLAAQTRIGELWSEYQDLLKTQAKMAGRAETRGRKLADVETRLSERGMEVDRTMDRQRAVADRSQSAQEQIADLGEAIEDLKAQAASPELAEKVAMLEDQYRVLKKAEERATVTPEDLERADAAERADVLAGPMRKVARILTGKGAMPKGAEPFWEYVARIGGIKDVGGNVLGRIGEQAQTKAHRVADRKPLINPNGLALDKLQERLVQDFPELRARGWGQVEGRELESRADDIIEALAESRSGRDPDWYKQEIRNPDDDLIVDMVNEFDRMQTQGLIPDFKTTREFADFMSGRYDPDRPGINAQAYDQMLADMDAAGQAVPPGGLREAAGEALSAERQGVAMLRQQIARARERLNTAQARGGAAAARTDEAIMAAKANRGRYGVLTDRADDLEIQQQLFREAQRLAKENADTVRQKIETELLGWEGDSAAGAKAALKSREAKTMGVEPPLRPGLVRMYHRGDAKPKTGEERLFSSKNEYGGQKVWYIDIPENHSVFSKVVPGQDFRAELPAGGAKELPRPSATPSKSADSAVDEAVNTILNSDRGLTDEQLMALAYETKDRIIAQPDGRLPYDMESPKPESFAQGDDTGPRRGSLTARRFAIPTSEVHDFIVRDIEEIARRQVNTMLPDILLASPDRFGHVEMQPQFKKINEEYNRLIAQAETPAEKQRLRARAKRDENALRGMLGRIRGTYGYSTNPTVRNLGRLANMARNYNYMVDLGGGAISQIGDLAGAVFHRGLTQTFKTSWAPLFRQLVTAGNDKQFVKYRKFAKSIGIGMETAMHQRANELGDMYYGHHELSRGERTMQTMASGFSRLNLMGPMTDMMKIAMTGGVADWHLRAIKAVAEGKGTKDQIRRLANATITPDMAKDIWRVANEGDGIENIDGVLLPNTETWSDRNLAERFENAVRRQVDIEVVTPGQEKPLVMSTPIGGMLLQFKSFVAGMNERVLLANLQTRDAKTISGLMTAMAMGALSYKLYTLATGQQASDKPEHWVKESIDRSGILGWINEANALSAKLTRGSIDIYRLVGADKPLTRYASRSIAGAFLGPTLGKIEGAGQVIGSLASGEWTASDTRRLRRLITGQNLFYIRRLLDEVEKGANETLGMPESERQAPQR